ncbi:uncharacterized protein VTP21DRAFT_2430 [Calcarisporiella thermophila]|uniref:uncharacterized protein n=1 Tax=Calcarisporiella thermophila TaxID=911321 RepID=UPI003744ACBB
MRLLPPLPLVATLSHISLAKPAQLDAAIVVWGGIRFPFSLPLLYYCLTPSRLLFIPLYPLPASSLD